MTNAHRKEDGEQSASFRLPYSHYDQSSLIIHENENPERFVYAPKRNVLDCIPIIPVSTTTAVGFQWKHLDQSHNSVVFDGLYRKRFQQQHLHCQTPQGRINVYWVSIPFRWGDVGKKDPTKPNIRCSLDFLDYCLCIHYILLINPHVAIFLVVEIFSRTDVCDVLKYINDHF